MSRIPYLSALIPADALFWYSLDQQTVEDGDDAAYLRDEESWADLTSSGSEPVWRELDWGEKYLEFDGAKSPLGSDIGLDEINIKHLFVIAAFAGEQFDDTNGLISPLYADNAILVGETGTSKFFNFSFPSLQYRKSGVLYAASNMQAPVENVPELIEWYYPAGFDADTLQIGKDRDNSGRLWNGRFDFAAGFGRQLTTLELAQIRLYANLKSRLFIALDQTLAFPAPEIIFDGVNCPYSEKYSRFYQVPLDASEITHSHTYDDNSKTFNRTNLQPPRRWSVEFNRISAAKAQVLDAFSEAVGINRTFDFYDYRRDKTYSGVRIERYERTHEGHLSMRNNCRFDLVKYV